MRPPIPHIRPWDAGAVQCDGCGGYGCKHCQNRGWVSPDSPHARKCARDGCRYGIPPDQLAVYCSDECAAKDATC